MARFLVLPFEVWHYMTAVATVGGSPDPWRDIEREAREHLVTGPAFTGLVDEAVAVCAGVHCQLPGRGEAWALMTPLAYQHPAFVTRSVIRYLRAIIQKEGLQRVEADVISTFAAGRYWVERMGFELECVKRKYCAGVDFAAYVLFPGENP